MSAPKSMESGFDLIRRGAVDLIDEKDLRAKLGRGPVTVKVGFDPSAPDIHLGHTVVLRKMRHFQDLGHDVVFVIGDFTGMIGDPTGKKTTRPQLTREEVAANAATYRDQASRILDFTKTRLEFNSRWLSALGAEGWIRLAAKMTVARILERDDFQKRWRAQQPIAVHELLYPLGQAYDSVALKADVELGGTDQLFNLLVGRDLMREHGLEPQVVLTLPLLVGTDGTEKMSKSLGNSIGISEKPSEIYGKLMSIPDALMWSYYELLTDLPEAEIAAMRRAIGEGANPRDAKARLARDITAQYHGAAEAQRAEDDFRRAFSAGELPQTIDRKAVPADAKEWGAAKVLVETGLAASMREARRKIAEGALTVYSGAPPNRVEREVRDANEKILASADVVVRLGRRFLEVTARS